MSEIQCSNFHHREYRIKSITSEINSQIKLKDKSIFARDLADEVEFLLNCEDYCEHEFDCINCHTISLLRKRTADLVLKTSLVLNKE